MLLAQPTDVVKVRYQASIGGNGHRYASTFDAYRTIARSEGLSGLWRGWFSSLLSFATLSSQRTLIDRLHSLIRMTFVLGGPKHL